MIRRLVFVGCNIGLDVDQLVAAHDICWLIEPIPEVATALRRRYKTTRDKVVFVIQKACYRESAFAPFRIYNKNGLSSSLGTVTPESRQAYATADLSLCDEITVECVNLNSLLPPDQFVDTLIIDAQGADLAILKTVHNRLARGLFGTVTAEADGDEFANYSGLEDNSATAMVRYMSQFPYDCRRVPGRVDWNPDFQWTLRRPKV